MGYYWTVDDTWPEGWTIEDEWAWAELCEEVDAEDYVWRYLPAGGTRTFEQWRHQEPVPTHSTRHDPLHADPGAHILPVKKPVPYPEVRPPMELELYR